MRFNFDLAEPDSRRSPTPPPSNSTPKAELQWFPLQNHPLFSSSAATATPATAEIMPPNLMAWDADSRLYIWDLKKKCLHRISIRLGETDLTSILAASPSKVLQAEMPLNFEVNRISINRNRSALLVVGLEGLRIMYLYGRSSMEENTIICRTVSIGSEIYFSRNNFIRILQISWHPYSDTHLGVLSSDSVFRIFDLSTDIGQPEQEYYLQPGSSQNAAAIRPVDFSFGGDHLWDKFTVFILFSDGSTYIICPVIPFGSVYKWESVLEMYNDAHTIGLKSPNSKAINNSNMAISWLEATFPELVREAGNGGQLHVAKAQPFVLLDASVTLQGPLRKVCHGSRDYSNGKKGVFEGRAVSFLYSLVGKDTIIVTAWSGGQLQLDALADEIQPVWKSGSAPRICVDSSDQILGTAMICESDPSVLKIDQPPYDTAWLGQPPPLLRLANVDLALPNKSSSLIGMITDPLLPERIFCVHSGGIDSIVLHFLPFTSQARGKEEPMRTPSVHSVLSTCPGDSTSPSPLHGFLALSDSFGSSWIVGLTSSNDCMVLQMESRDLLLTDVFDKMREVLMTDEIDEVKDMDTPTIISKELLSGPKAVLMPPSAPSLRSITADSIEGRSTLHQYFKLFHENYVEYAHKVYFELQHHAPQLKKIIDNQHSQLREMQQKLLEVEKKKEVIDDRVDRAVNLHSTLEDRLQNLRCLPGSHKKPLSKAERDFKSELDNFSGLEMDALHSSIEALSARLKRHMHSVQAKSSNQVTHRAGRRVEDDDICQLKSSLSKLSLINRENSKKVKLVESALRSKEISDR
ncbi:hypothetical protein ACS0TY_033038 [Phlomoides rotata]